jgi:heterotetrameric sarcosine oxidase gamma subunit
VVDVILTERTGLEMAQISAWPAASRGVFRILTEVLDVPPPELPNTVANQGQTKILWLGPNRWLIVRPTKSHDLASELAARLPFDSAAVVELGAGRCVFAVSGPRARDVLVKHLPLDLSASQFSVGRCAQSAIAHIGVLIHAEGQDRFELFVYRSFAQHLWTVLTDAALEFGLEVQPREVGG